MKLLTKFLQKKKLKFSVRFCKKESLEVFVCFYMFLFAKIDPNFFSKKLNMFIIFSVLILQKLWRLVANLGPRVCHLSSRPNLKEIDNRKGEQWSFQKKKKNVGVLSLIDYNFVFTQKKKNLKNSFWSWAHLASTIFLFFSIWSNVAKVTLNNLNLTTFATKACVANVGYPRLYHQIYW